MLRPIATIALLLSVVSAQSPQLRIVVLEGENAVNIIQQKTAVKALVEVRDQNNLPVSGATVTFAVTGKGGATVAGAQTVTVTSGTTGQAALTGMTPSSSGGLQISVNASFKGLSATTSITQTVVATTAAAAAIAGTTAGTVAAGGATTGATAAAGGAAAATGGGLGTGAIIGIVGGVAAAGAGVAVATGATGGQRDERDVITGPPPECVFAVEPREITVPISGGSYVVTVTVSPANCMGSTWRVDTNLASNFVSANPTSVTGTGTTTLTVAPFTPTQSFPSRSGAIGVANTVVAILQPFAPR